MLPELDPGEAILAVNGCEDVISGKPARITRTEMVAIATFPERVIKLAAQLCRGKTPVPYKRLFVDDYDDMLEELTTPPDREWFDATAAAFPPAAQPAVGLFFAASGRAYTYLAETYPKVAKPEMLGTRNLPASGLAMGEWESCWSVVAAPLVVFDLVSTARLQKRQVEALRAVYPSLLKFVMAAIYEAMLGRRAREPKWQPPFAQGVATLLGVPSLSPELASALVQAGNDTRALNEEKEAKQMAARTAATRTAPASQRQEMQEAREAQL